MIVTEEEAKTKWCPFVRYDWINHAGIFVGMNRPFDPDNQAITRNCLASGCMAWVDTRRIEHEASCSVWPIRQMNSNQDIHAPCNCSKPTTGYCGAFTQP